MTSRHTLAGLEANREVDPVDPQVDVVGLCRRPLSECLGVALSLGDQPVDGPGPR